MITETEQEIEERVLTKLTDKFFIDLSPLCWSDVQEGIKHLRQYHIDESLTDLVAEQQELNENNAYLDVCSIAYEYVFNEMTQKLYIIAKADLNKMGFYVYANSIATTIDRRNESEEDLLTAIIPFIKLINEDEDLVNYIEEELNINLKDVVQ